METWTKEEIAEHIKTNVKDYGAVVVVAALYKKHPDLNLDFRSFIHATDARFGDPQNWKDTVNIIMGVKNF